MLVVVLVHINKIQIMFQEELVVVAKVADHQQMVHLILEVVVEVENQLVQMVDQVLL
jgi:hypothetical protein